MQPSGSSGGEKMATLLLSAIKGEGGERARVGDKSDDQVDEQGMRRL
jgi:hypothetical protein